MALRSSASKATPSGLKLPANGHVVPQTGGVETPRTPQDEALAFFSQTSHVAGEPVQVWELQLEDDEGPGESKSVSSPINLPYALALHYELPCSRLHSWSSETDLTF